VRSGPQIKITFLLDTLHSCPQVFSYDGYKMWGGEDGEKNGDPNAEEGEGGQTVKCLCRRRESSQVWLAGETGG